MSTQEGRPAQCEDTTTVLDESFRCEDFAGHAGRHSARIGVTEIAWWPHGLAVWPSCQVSGEAA